MSEIVSACESEEELIISGNYSCNHITDSQRETLSEIFDEFNNDGDNKWSMDEFEVFFMQTDNENDLFDEIDTDDDGEIDFVEMMASLKKQSQITPDLFNTTYNQIIYELYNMEYNLSNYKYFAYAADYVFNQSFGSIYTGYPSGIKKSDWMNITCNQQFDALEDDQDDDDMIDLDEFIDKSFMGYGLMYYVVYTDIKSIYNASQVTETDIEAIVDEINASYDVWSNGLDKELSINSTSSNRRRLIRWNCNRFTSRGCKTKCGKDGMQQSVACAGCDPSLGCDGCGKSSSGYIACLNEECETRGYSEKSCRDYVNSNV